VAGGKTPWQQILSRHLRRATLRRRGSRDYTYARPHRRQATLGGANSPIRPSTFDPMVEAAVVVDTSGSMGEAEILLALTEIDSILRATGSSVTVLSCDAKVHATGKVTRAADAAKLLKGGGGTDFRPAFDALAPLRPAVTVVVTDGYGPAPSSAPVWTDTIWVLVGQYTQRPCEWGEVVEVGK
jgi:predicted metal-dependent peptidase